VADRPKEHELVRASRELLGELNGRAEKLAGDLFPQGVAGGVALPKEAELDLVARHWDDPAFRQTLLTRLAPPGPDGTPTYGPGIAEFKRLYSEAVLKRGNPAHALPMAAGRAADAPAVPGLGPLQARQLERAPTDGPLVAPAPPAGADPLSAAPPPAAPPPGAVPPPRDRGASRR
jgi:hypothetical protein